MRMLIGIMLAAVTFTLSACTGAAPYIDCGPGFYWDQGTGRCLVNGDSSLRRH